MCTTLSANAFAVMVGVVSDLRGIGGEECIMHVPLWHPYDFASIHQKAGGGDPLMGSPSKQNVGEQ